MTVYVYQHVDDNSFKCLFLELLEVHILSGDILKDMSKDKDYKLFKRTSLLTLFCKSINEASIQNILNFKTLIHGSLSFKDFKFSIADDNIILQNKGKGYVITKGSDYYTINNELKIPNLSFRFTLDCIRLNDNGNIAFDITLSMETPKVKHESSTMGFDTLLREYVGVVFDLSDYSLHLKSCPKYYSVGNFKLKDIDEGLRTLKSVSVSKFLLLQNSKG